MVLRILSCARRHLDRLLVMAGVRFRRSLFPGFSDSSEYTFGCPSSTTVLTEPPDAGDHAFDGVTLVVDGHDDRQERVGEFPFYACHYLPTE